MFDVFFLFAVAGGFLEGFDDEGGGGWFDGDGGLTVLDGEFDGDALWRGEKGLLLCWCYGGGECIAYESFLGKNIYVSRGFFFGGGVEGGQEDFTQSPVALAISSPTFLGDRPRGPIWRNARFSFFILFSSLRCC